MSPETNKGNIVRKNGRKIASKHFKCHCQSVLIFFPSFSCHNETAFTTVPQPKEIPL